MRIPAILGLALCGALSAATFPASLFNAATSGAVSPGGWFQIDLYAGFGPGAEFAVSITVGNTTRNVPLLFPLPPRIAGILPADLPAGDGTFSVTSNVGISYSGKLQVAPRSFGIFTRNGRGTGPALLNNLTAAGEYQLNAFTNAAHPGQTLVLWGTGLGGPADAGGVEVLVGNRAVKPRYAGPSGCCSGIDQINFDAPSGVEGCFVPVAIRFADGTLSLNFGSVSIAAQGGACSDPYNAPAVDLERTYSGQPVKQSSILLTGQGTLNLYGRFADRLWLLNAAPDLPPQGSCAVQQEYEPSPSPLVANPIPGLDRTQPVGAIDAGAALTVDGPGGAYRVPGPAYSQQQPYGVWQGGAYTVGNGPGSEEVGPFQAVILVPPVPFRWVGWQEGPAPDGSGGLTFRWDGGDPAREYVVIQGSNENAGLGFTCTERADKGTFTVPAYIVVNTNSPAGGIFSHLDISVAARSLPQVFSARGLDFGELQYEQVYYSSYYFPK